MLDQNHNTAPEPGLLRSAVCLAGILLIILTGLVALNVSLHILLIIALLWAGWHGMSMGLSFKDIRSTMNQGIVKGLGAIYIFLLIGLVIASFIESGTVAALIHYGLSYLTPGLFLPFGLILCSLMSLATGTSWGTVATAGVILLGIGSALGIPMPLTAGMIISGASFGDKMSPVSDTTNLAAMSSETTLNTHIRTMFLTSGPAFLIALGIFTWLGTGYADGAWSAEPVAQIQQGLEQQFVITPWSLLPMVVMLIMSQRRYASELAMIASVIVAGVFAITVQDSTFSGFLNSMQQGYQSNTGVEVLDNLLTRGGIQNMMWTLSLSLIALALGGVLHALGVVQVLMAGLLKKVQHSRTLIPTTIVTGIFTNMAMGEAYLSIIMGGQVFREKFQQLKLDNSMLSRCLEEGATLSTGIIPWTTAGLFYSATLGVSVLDYAPWALFNLINPVLSIALAWFGIAVLKREDEGFTQQPLDKAA